MNDVSTILRHVESYLYRKIFCCIETDQLYEKTFGYMFQTVYMMDVWELTNVEPKHS